MKWLFFNGFVLFMIALDLGFLSKRTNRLSIKNALLWTILWIVVALWFNAGVYVEYGPKKALEFFTGYVLEKSLSMDNIFVFVMIFAYFKVPLAHQHKVLAAGILGALVMRAVFIFVGIELIRSIDWILYAFGALLVLTGLKMLLVKEQENLTTNPILNWISKHAKITPDFHGNQFFVRINSVLYMTPLALCLIMIELSDLIFALDSIPAILAVTQDPFIVYTANVFAILGLRSMYFILAHMAEKFRHLKYGISIILIFVGVKMGLMHIYTIPIGITLAVIAVCFITSIAYSHWKGTAHDR